MQKRRTGFWRGFTWQRMWKNFIFIFLLTLLIEILFNIRNPEESLQLNALLRRFITATILSFIFTVWHEPGIDDNDKADQRAA
jgi:hypothetical protein